MLISAADISELVNGELEGDHTTQITSISKIDQADPGSITFLSNQKYTPFIYDTKASVVLVSKDFAAEQPVAATLIRVPDPYSSFTVILEKYFNNHHQQTGIEDGAFVSESATLGPHVYVGAQAYVGHNATVGEGTKIFPNSFIGPQVTLGKNCIIHSGVKIYHACEIGDDVIIHANTVIGSDGFGFAPQQDGSYKKIPQTGNVVIHNHVEIGASCTIDRATIGSTIIHEGVKLDNLIQVAHNVEIGAHTVIASQTGISGSTKIGKHCVIGGQVGFVGHITVADGTQIGAQSGIPKAIKEPNKKWIGSPILELKDSLKAQVVHRNLPSLQNRIAELERQLKELLEQKNNK